MLKRLWAFAFLFFISDYCFSQSDSTDTFKLSGYLETYYSFDFLKPTSTPKPDYNYNYKNHNQLSVNLAFVKASYASKKVRSNLALMVGDYAKYNLSAEPNWAKPLFEANVGYKPFKQQNIWIDAGVMPSHIGFESAIGGDCYNLTRSILAENSPYYESGIKVSYTAPQENLYIAFLVLNGWQKIEMIGQNFTPSVGVQINYKAAKNLTLNYSNFIGNVNLDPTKALRAFHNLYAIYEATERSSFIFGFDIGTQKTKQTRTAIWYTPVIISKFKLNSKHTIAGRAEYYHDKNEIIIPTATLNGYQTFGASINYDYQISPKMLWRAELKRYASKDPIFKYAQQQENHTAATMAFIVRL